MLVTRPLLEPVMQALRERCEVEVYEGEFAIPRDDRLKRPHLRSATIEIRTEMRMLAPETLFAALEGGRPPTLLNPEDWQQREEC